MNGWKLVPVEPTDEMIAAANAIPLEVLLSHTSIEVKGLGYKAMLEVAPQPPSVGDADITRWLPQKTPIGTVLKPNPEGYLVALDDHLAAVTARDQQLVVQAKENEALRARVAELLETAKTLTIQLHATYGNTEHHEDCMRDLEALAQQVTKP